MALPPSVVSACAFNLEEVLAAEVGALESFCGLTPPAQRGVLERALGDASDLPQHIMESVAKPHPPQVVGIRGDECFP